jgi:hypothetical protein
MKFSTCLVISTLALLVIVWLGIPEPNPHAFEWLGGALRWLLGIFASW